MPMQNAHTPGPWTIEPGDSGDESVGLHPTPTVIFTTVPNDDRSRCLDIATIGPAIYGDDEEGHPLYFGDADANARLIAAAPELLVALQANAFVVGALAEQPWLDAAQREAAKFALDAATAVIAKVRS